MDLQEPHNVKATPENDASKKNEEHEALAAPESVQKSSPAKEQLSLHIMLTEGAIREYDESIMRAVGDVEAVERVIGILKTKISGKESSSQEANEEMEKLQLELRGKQASLEIKRERKLHAEEKLAELKVLGASSKE